jgi:ring-1,2-phenylacetyl-CoA epoxidase subunit PaaE
MIVHAGTATTVRVEPGETLLDSGLRAGLELPYSCRSGICGTCYAVIQRGEMGADLDASGADPSSGALLACQAWPLSDDVAVDFDMVSPPSLSRELEVP